MNDSPTSKRISDMTPSEKAAAIRRAAAAFQAELIDNSAAIAAVLNDEYDETACAEQNGDCACVQMPSV